MADMTIYVAEINGRAIAAMNAESNITAEDWFGGPEFHTELTLLRDEAGHPLWDGQAEIHVRTADSHEEEVWRRQRSAAVTDYARDEDEAHILVFLIPVSEEDREDRDN